MLAKRHLVDDASAARSVAAKIRETVDDGARISEQVQAIIASISSGGDNELARLVGKLDRGSEEPAQTIAVEPERLEAAAEALAPDVAAGLKSAIENVTLVCEATCGQQRTVKLAQGQTVTVREIPVRRAAVYVPGGRAPYPSSVVMGVCAARAAGVEEIVVASPSDNPVLLGACALTGADEVYHMGGAHSIAALALGTETIAPVDVIVGPGNLWVQEAKRQLSGRVGIDGFAGPSDLLVIADADSDPELIALDLGAQAEHGAGSLVVFGAADESLLDSVAALLERGVGGGLPASETGAQYEFVKLADLSESALALIEAIAPEHLELIGALSESLAPLVRSAGCLFVGAASATAFGDYVVGSNHTLPTAGAARFSSGLSARTFRRTMCEVRVDGAAEALAPLGGAIADAEGFAVHAASMRARQNG